MDKQKIETLLRNGLFLSYHAKDKMRLEKISMEQIKEALLNGVSKADNSTQNDKSFAWNKAQHFSVYHEGLNLTVVFCESREKGLMLVSAYRGKAHQIETNPYYRKRLYY